MGFIVVAPYSIAAPPRRLTLIFDRVND
jgi:hypothetical protein